MQTAAPLERAISGAGTPEPEFRELLTKWLRAKLADLRKEYGEDSREYLALYRQYVRDSREDAEMDEHNAKHYEAAIALPTAQDELPGLERLYRRAMVVEPTFSCVAHCRYCLRAYYTPKFTMSADKMIEAARFCGTFPVSEHVREVLITGGDPLVMPTRLRTLVDALAEYAPNVTTLRLATRVPTQDPARINDAVLDLLQSHPHLRFEVATQINHPVEFFPEVVEALRRILDLGVRVYSQNVLLKGVNDDRETLVELYDGVRTVGLEAHYLFHAIPLQGTHHLRTSLAKGLRLATQLCGGGEISGRAKPMFAVMTDIGKVVLYHGTLLRRDGDRVLIQTGYRVEDRLRWNPSWTIPETVEVDEDGLMRVWYLDGEE